MDDDDVDDGGQPTCVMLFRDMFLLKGDAAEGAGELALNESFRLRATDCLRSSSSFLEITSLTLGATNLRRGRNLRG